MIQFTMLKPFTLILFIIGGAFGRGRLVYEIQFGESKKQEFVDAHNTWRANVAPKAANMRKLEWDDEIEQKALQFVRRCAFYHSNPPLKTSEFEELGENLYAGTMYRYSDLPSKLTEAWGSESAYYDINGNPKCIPGKKCGHYTQLVWADTQKMGCALGVCSKTDGGSAGYLVACLYGPAGNEAADLVPYKTGESCTNCPLDAPLCNNNLCTAG